MDWETTVKVKTVNDGSGAEAAKKDQKALGDEAERTAARTAAANAKAEKSFGLIQKGIAGVRRAMGTLNTVITGFGLIGIITTLVGWFKSLKEWIGKSAEEAKRLREEAKLTSVVRMVNEVEEAQQRLNASIRETLTLMDEENAKADAAKSRQRAVEDAKLKREEARALEGVEDPDEQSRIRSRYAKRRAELGIARAQEDENEAGRRATVKVGTQEANVVLAKDQVISARSAIKVSDEIASRTKDPEKLKEIQQRRKQLEEQLAKAQAELEKQKQLLQRAKEEREKVAGMSEAAVISGQADLQNIGNSDAARERAAEQRRAEAKRKEEEAAAEAAKKAAQKAADEKTVSEGKSKIAELEADADAERVNAQAAADRYAKEAGEAHDAQNRYDMVVANGGSRKDRSAALAALQKEQREAEEAKHEMERVAAEVATTLQGINAQIKALSSAVKKAEGRLAQNQADAPEG